MALSIEYLLKLPVLAILFLNSYFISDNSISNNYIYTSIISFGDSLTDTGNNVLSGGADSNPAAHRLPYGMTYFHHPAGRASDGRLTIDFIAEAFGLPYLQPSLAKGRYFEKGVNFAVAGATALDTEFFVESGLGKFILTNLSLSVQLRWFEEFKTTLCTTLDDCRSYFGRTLFVVGEIGGNDYNFGLLNGKTLEEVTSYMPEVIEAITNATERLINHGAVELLVPGNLPIGCLSGYLTAFTSSNPEDYDPTNGCLVKLNNFAMLHNTLLSDSLNQLQKKHPSVRIMYADYYHAVLQLANSPVKFGLQGGVLRCCCGGGGMYNFNKTTMCGHPGSSVCSDPSLYMNWDGVHLTEAAYRAIAGALLQTNTYPPLLRRQQ